MTSQPFRTCLLFAGLCAAFPVVAEAQAPIYTWRDSSGHPVLSDRAKDPSARIYIVNPEGGIQTAPSPVKRRLTAYDTAIEEHANTNGLSSDLVRAVIQAESAFNPLARSIKGAMGLMQLMPATAAEYGVADPYNPAENIRAGVAYLKSLLTRYSHNQELALAAYNAGPSAVEKYRAVPPYRETRTYVEKIRRATAGSPAPAHIYRSVEIVNGREVPRYSSIRTAGAEVVTTATRR